MAAGLKNGDTKQQRVNLLGELSGSIGDLGTFLPYVLGVVSLGGFSLTSIFTGFGLFYVFCGWFYRIPMAVQPMKVISAAVLVHNLTPGEVAAGSLMIGLVLLVLGLTGLIETIARITPQGVTSGIQVGLGLSLAILGVKMIGKDPVLGWIIMILMLPLLKSKRFPAAIMAIVVGTAINLLLHPGLALPSISIGIHLPTITLPTVADFNRGFFLAALPQLPLTLTNAVLVTAAISHQLYDNQAARVNNKNLCITMGAANLIVAPFGGYTMCHGSGGVAAHHRFGGRTKYTTYFIGFALLAIGLFLGDDGAQLLSLIPEAALGCLLFFSGVDLASAAKGIDNRSQFFLVLTVAALTLAINPAVAFIAGFILAKGMEKKWIKI